MGVIVEDNSYPPHDPERIKYVEAPTHKTTRPSRLSLALPDLRPGAEPPPECPGCSSPEEVGHPQSRDAGKRIPGLYECGGRIAETDCKSQPCPNPSPEAVQAAQIEEHGAAVVIRAALANLTPEQREARAVGSGDQDDPTHCVEVCLEAAADSLEQDK